MKWMLYVIILAMTLLVPVQGTDVGKLRPVEVLSVAQSEAGIRIRTDTGDMGTGSTMERAVWNLKESAPGVIYLDTAQWLLLETDITEMEDLQKHLKENVQVTAAEEGIPLEGTAQYLQIHQPKYKLKDGCDYQKLEILWEEDGRYLLE